MSECSSCSDGSCSSGQGAVVGIPNGSGVTWGAGAARSKGLRAQSAQTKKMLDGEALRVESAEADAHLLRLYTHVADNKIPFWAHIDLTYKCNTDCIHCYCQHLDKDFGKENHEKDLSTQEVKDLLDQLAAAGTLHLTLSGGELFVRRDFFEIAEYAVFKKNFALKLFTNGTIMTEEMADRLVELHPLVVEVSLQGATAAVHDKIVGMLGSFDRVVRTVRMLRERGLNIVLKSTLMEPNFHQAAAIAELSQELGVPNYRSTLEITPKNDGDFSVTQYQLSDEQLLEYLVSPEPSPMNTFEPEQQAEARKKGTCGVGETACYISPYGDVYPCIQLLISMGNVRTQPFADIWRAPSELRKKLDQIQQYEDLPDCKTCEYVQFCRRCHGIAYMETGDLTKCHKLALRMAKATQEANAIVRNEKQASIQLN